MPCWACWVSQETRTDKHPQSSPCAGGRRWDWFACSFQSLTSARAKFSHDGGNSHTSGMHHLDLLATVQDGRYNGLKRVFPLSPGTSALIRKSGHARLVNLVGPNWPRGTVWHPQSQWLVGDMESTWSSQESQDTWGDRYDLYDSVCLNHKLL